MNWPSTGQKSDQELEKEIELHLRMAIYDRVDRGALPVLVAGASRKGSETVFLAK